MATSCIIVNHKRAPIGTQQLRLSKGVEQCYYALLFSSSPSYKNRPGVWRAWLAMGLDIAVKAPPPGTADTDKITITVRSNGKAPEIYGASSNKEALQRLNRLLQDIDVLRGSVAGKNEAAKADVLLGNPKVAQQLVQPLTGCLKQSGLRPDEVESFRFMVRRGLLALTHDEVASIQISLD